MNGNHRKRNGEERVMEEASRLPVDIPPERDLWPEIAARLEQREKHASAGGRWRLVGAVAAAAALVAVSSLVTLWVTDKHEPVTVSRIQPPRGMTRPATTNATFGPDYVLGPKYEKARQQLSRALDEQLKTLSPETREIVEKNLSQIRQAMSEINAALADDPGNVLLQQLLMAAYQDEMTVLMEVNRMAQSLPTRKEI
jgi:hypothetical protein